MFKKIFEKLRARPLSFQPTERTRLPLLLSAFFYMVSLLVITMVVFNYFIEII